jgi:hypothetical protein
MGEVRVSRLDQQERLQDGLGWKEEEVVVDI